jgi:hypothetical protein
MTDECCFFNSSGSFFSSWSEPCSTMDGTSKFRSRYMIYFSMSIRFASELAVLDMLCGSRDLSDWGLYLTAVGMFFMRI